MLILLLVLLSLLVSASIALDYLWFIVSPLVLVLLVVVILLVEDFTDIIAWLVIAETRIWLVIWLTICHRLLLFLPRVRLFSILLMLVAILECLVLLLLLLNWLLQGILVRVGVRVQLWLDKSAVTWGLLSSAVREWIRDICSVDLLIWETWRVFLNTLAHQAWLVRLLSEPRSIEFFVLRVLAWDWSIVETVWFKHLLAGLRVVSVGLLLILSLLNHQVLRWRHLVAEVWNEFRVSGRLLPNLLELSLNFGYSWLSFLWWVKLVGDRAGHLVRVQGRSFDVFVVSASQCYIFTVLVSSVEILVVIVIAGGFKMLIDHLKLFVEHWVVRLVFVNVLEVLDLCWNLALGVSDSVGLLGFWQFALSVVVVVPDLVWFCGIDSMRIEWGLIRLVSWALIFLFLWGCSHLERIIMFGVDVFITPFRMASAASFRWPAPRRWVGHSLTARSTFISIRLLLGHDNVAVVFLTVHGDAGAWLVLTVAVASDLTLDGWASIRHRHIHSSRFSHTLNRSRITLLTVCVSGLTHLSLLL